MPGSEAGSDVGSASEGASVTGSMRDATEHHHNDDDHDLLDTNAGVKAAVFGVVYTLSKEKYEHSPKYAIAKLVIDFLQLFILIVNPHFGWHINESFWLWKYILYLQFRNPIISKGYNFYITILYLTVAVLAIGATLCLYVGWCFKNDRFPYVWPIKVVRFVVSVFFVTFYIGSLSVFLLALQCNWFSKDAHIRFHMDHFGKECFKMPHLVHAFVAALATIIFIFITVIMTVADFELNPVAQGLLAAPISTVELRAIIMRTVIIFSSSFLDGRDKLQVLVIFGAMFLMFWSCLRWMPHYNKWMNHVKTGMYCGLTWAAGMLVVMVIAKDHPTNQFRVRVTNVMLGCLAPFMLLGFALSYVRFELFFRAGMKAFQNPDPKLKLKDIYKFSEEYQVEVLVRCCRKWVDEDTLDQDASKLAEFIIRAGLARFGSNASLVVLYSNFLMEVQGLYQNGLSQLQAAKKLHPNISQQFIIFAREQMHRQRAQTASSGEGAVDLVSYVEFQKNYRSLLRAHKAALYSARIFWKKLLSHNISFSALTKAFGDIESNQKRAEKTYQMVLERYPQSAKLLRIYGRFLEDVKHDPWGANRHYTEADKIEEETEQGNNVAGFGVAEFNDADAAIIGQLNDKNSPVVLCNAQGVIQMANKLALKTFGYKKGELEGKNVSMLMPQPFSQRHDSFLRAYIQTGKTNILNQIRGVVGLHRDHHVFPIRVAVTKASGTGSDSVFMGIFLPEEDNDEVVRCWVMTNGVILCVNDRFTDWFAKSHHDILGTTFDTLAVEQDRMQELLAAATTATEDEFKAGRIAVKGVSMLHKYLGSLECNIRCTLGGSDAQRLLLMEISRTASNSHTTSLFVTDSKGTITFATYAFAHLLGYQPSDMVGRMGLNNLMNPPFSHLHAKWLAELPPKVTLSSCRNSATVVAVTAAGSSIPVRMSIEQREDAGEVIFLVKFWKSNFDEGLNLRRLSASVDQDGVVTQVSSTPAALFGFRPPILMDADLHDFVGPIHDLVEQSGVAMKAVLQALVAKSVATPGFSWRVGVHAPVSEAVAAEIKTSATAAAIWKTQVRAAVMTVDVKAGEAEDDPPTTMVHLSRADAITGIIEVDRSGRVTKAGCCPLHMAGPVFGCPSPALLRQPLSRYVDLQGKTVQEALLDQAEESGKGKGKKVLKNSGKKQATKMGSVRRFVAMHTDGEPLTVSLQAVPKDATKRRIVIKINPVSLSKGSASVLKCMLMDQHHSLSAGALHGDAGKQTSAPGDRRPSVTSSQDGDMPWRPRNHSDFKAVGGGPRSMPALAEDEEEDAAGQEQEQELDEPEVVAAAEAVGLPDALAPNDDAMSMVSASQMDGTSNAGDDDQGTDYRKGKRFKKLIKMLAGKRTQLVIARFHQQTYLVLAAQLLIHLIAFSLFTNFINALNAYVHDVDAVGQANDMLHRVAMNALILRELHQGREVPGIFTTHDIPHYTQLMRERINEFQNTHNGIFLGFTQLRHLRNIKGAPLQDLLERPNMRTKLWADTREPQMQETNTSLWELGNMYIMSAREVMANHDRMAHSSKEFDNHTADLDSNRFWRFVVDNGPYSLFDGYRQVQDALVTRAMQQVQQVNVINISLLVVEGCLVGAIAMTLMWILMRRVINLRYRLFTTFLIIPAGFLRVLACKRVQVDDEDADNTDSEDGDAVDPAEAPQTTIKEDTQTAFLQLGFSTRKAAVVHGGLVKRTAMAVWNFIKGDGDVTLSSRRKLHRDAKDVPLVVVPFMFWSLLVLIVYAISYKTLAASSTGLINNTVAQSLVFRIVRVLFFSLNFSSRETTADKEELRSMVQLTSSRLRSVYETLMLGTHRGDYSDSKYSTQGTAFNKMGPVADFYRSKAACFRRDQSSCHNQTSEFYQISHHGLDAMVLRLVEESSLLSRDTDRDVNMSSDRMSYIWKVANYDLHEGTQSAAQQYTSQVLHSFSNALNMHVVLFVLSWLLVFLFVLFIFKPFLKRLQSDSRRVAELLCQLPADMDVESLVSQALGDGNGDEEADAEKREREEARAAKRAASAAQRASSRHSMDELRTRRASFSIPGEN